MPDQPDQPDSASAKREVAEDAPDEKTSSSEDAKAKEGAAIRSDLNQLWKSTVSQFDEMKEILVRSGSAGKAKLEVTILKRQQDKLFAELGALLYRDRKKEGAPAFPDDAKGVLRKLDSLQSDIDDQKDAFDSLTKSVDDAPPEASEKHDAGPAPEVVDAKDPPSQKDGQ